MSLAGTGHILDTNQLNSPVCFPALGDIGALVPSQLQERNAKLPQPCSVRLPGDSWNDRVRRSFCAADLYLGACGMVSLLSGSLAASGRSWVH